MAAWAQDAVGTTVTDQYRNLLSSVLAQNQLYIGPNISCVLTQIDQKFVVY